MKTKIFAIIATAVAALVCSVFILSAQKAELAVTVVDEDREPIIGVTIMCETCGKGIGITDMDGRIIIGPEHKDHWIRVSYVGYISQRFKYTGKEKVIVLKEDNEFIEP